ncbi:MAG: Dna2/Cas4 domain-containing protein [bacterium]
MAGYILLILAGLCLLLWLALPLVFPRRVAGLPHGEVVYSGHDSRAESLHAPGFGLSGKPDYVVRQGEELVPVEPKSGRASKKLYDSVRMQVIAQALLVEAEFGKRPTHGLVKYPTRTYRVDVTPQDVARLEEALQVMRHARETGMAPDAPTPRHLCPTCTREACPKRAGDRQAARSTRPTS